MVNTFNQKCLIPLLENEKHVSGEVNRIFMVLHLCDRPVVGERHVVDAVTHAAIFCVFHPRLLFLHRLPAAFLLLPAEGKEETRRELEMDARA